MSAGKSPFVCCRFTVVTAVGYSAAKVGCRANYDTGEAMSTATLHWECRRFDELSTSALYAMLALRARVFVVEQACAYLDPDGLDEQGYHWLGWSGEKLVAHQRCLPPGVPYGGESSIGRIVVDPQCRGQDLGRRLVDKGIAFNQSQWPGTHIRIGAQSQLTRFYESLGFVVCGKPYMEDGIEHVEMRLRAS